MNRASIGEQGNRVGEVEQVQVACEDRMGMLPAVFGRLALEFELSVYGWMENLCEGYTGGYWEFYRLSNGGFGGVQIRPGAGYRGVLSVEGLCFRAGGGVVDSSGDRLGARPDRLSVGLRIAHTSRCCSGIVLRYGNMVI